MQLDQATKTKLAGIIAPTPVPGAQPPATQVATPTTPVAQSSTPSTGLDPRAYTLTKAIGTVESGGVLNYTNQSGDGGTSAGAYQWNNGKQVLQPGQIPVNFQNQAKSLGLNPNDFSPTNQNQVAYTAIKQKLDQGWKPSQVASWWNSGDPNAYASTVPQKVGNTPQYVQNVQKTAQQLWSQQNQNQPQGSGGLIPTAYASTGQNQPAGGASQGPSIGGFIGNIASSAGNILGGLGNAVMHPIQTVENLAGTVAGAVEKPFGVNNGDTQKFDNMVNYFGQRYGGNSFGEVLNHIGNTLYNDPVGAALDVSTLLDGVGAAVGTVGKIADVSRAAELAKASDFISTAAGLIKGGTPEATKALTTAGTMTNVADTLKGISSATNPITLGAKAITAPLSWLSDYLPGATFRSVATRVQPGSDTEQFGLPNLVWGGVKKNLNVAEAQSTSLFNQISGLVDKAGISSMGATFGTDFLDQLRETFPNLGKSDEQIFARLKTAAQNEGGLVDKMANGETVSMGDIYKLKVALQQSSYLIGKVDDPTIRANAALAATASRELGDIIKESVPKTAPLFNEYSKWLNLRTSLRYATKADKGVLTMKDIMSFIGGHAFGAGIPAFIIEKALSSPNVRMLIAKGLSVTDPIVQKALQVAVTAANVESKGVLANRAASGPSDVSPTGNNPQPGITPQIP